MVINMKPNVSSKPLFSPEQIAAAQAAAPDQAVADEDNPATRPEDWERAIVSYSADDLRRQLAQRRARGPNKNPRKEQVALRLSPEVLSYFRATGPGWQTRINDVLKEWVAKRAA